jgi:hypothetical protein
VFLSPGFHYIVSIYYEYAILNFNFRMHPASAVLASHLTSFKLLTSYASLVQREVVRIGRPHAAHSGRLCWAFSGYRNHVIIDGMKEDD